jgi:lipopolysaccharide/colanic/teichoic acid biosynthesis glycosyltransferase
MNSLPSTRQEPLLLPLQPSAETQSASNRSLRRSLLTATRRALDIFVAGALLLVLAPLLLVIALVIRLESGGPAIFRQQRLGHKLHTFTIFKFRTMRHEADVTPHREYVQSLIERPGGSEDGRLYKLSVDDRVTTVGRFLRSWSLDELPQLLNVLRGHMALVGPRPVIPYEVDLYPESYLGRFAVKPGLTGLWQVSGRNERTYDEMVRLDVEYAERASLLLDLSIIARTVPILINRRGVA